MRIFRAAALSLAAIGYSAVHAENFGDIFARCYSESNRKPGETKASFTRRCEQYAQDVKDRESRSQSNASSTGPNMRLLKPAVSVYQCTQEKTNAILGSLLKSQFADGSQAESFVWSKVLDMCSAEFTSVENESMLFQNFTGDRQRMIDFRDGMLWSARAQVLTTVIDWYAKR